MKNYEIIDSPKRNSKVTKKQEREDKLTQYLLLEVTIDNPKKSYIFFDDVIQVSSGGNIVPSINNTVLNYEKIPALEDTVWASTLTVAGIMYKATTPISNKYL